MSLHDLEIRVLTENDFAEYLRIMADAYPGANIRTKEDIDKNVGIMKKRMTESRITIFGAFYGDSMVAGMRCHDYKMNIRGTMIQTGGLGGVAVDLVHKKERIAKKLVEFYLDYYDKKEYPMTILWPFRSDFYQNMGFGLGSPMYRYSVDPNSFPKGNSKKHVRYLTIDDKEKILECYNRYAYSHNGLIDRTDREVGLFFENAEGTRIVGVEVNDCLEGYTEFSFSSNSKSNSMNNDMHIDAFISNSEEASSELYTFINSQLDQISRILFHTNDEYFYHHLKIPYTENPDLIYPIHQESFHAGVGVMYQILHPEKLFRLLKNSRFGNAELTVGFKLKYDFYKNETLHLQLSFQDGMVVLNEKDELSSWVELSIADFSSLTMGAINLSALCRFNRAKVSDNNLISKVDHIFFTEQKPLCLTRF